MTETAVVQMDYRNSRDLSITDEMFIYVNIMKFAISTQNLIRICGSVDV